MVQVNRRDFIVGAGLAAGAVLADEEKTVDGGFAQVSLPGVPERKSHIVPPGAIGFDNFSSKCVGCQLCVQQCENHVLRPSKDVKRFMQPEMGFEHGYCRPECTKCGEVCPAGAIHPVTVERKRNIHLGHAIWHKDRCIVLKDGVSCDACARHCPAGAIYMVALNESSMKSLKVPSIDKMKCIGCGACEHLCAARPMPGMTVKGFGKHREVVRMGDEDVLAEVRRLFAMNKMAVVFVKDGVIVAGGNGRGLSPLLDLCDRSPKEAKGVWVVDKVIGKAAAALCVHFGVARVHAPLMCEAGRDLLKANGIECSADQVVAEIFNRERTGMCPLEETVKDIADVPAMVKAIRAKLKQLKKAAK